MSNSEAVIAAVGGGGKRVRRSAEQRRRIVEETFVPGASVAVVARTHGVNANQVFAWRRLYRAGQLGPTTAMKTSDNSTALLPVRIAEESKGIDIAVTAAPSDALQGGERGIIHIQFSNVQLHLEGCVDQATLRVVLELLR
jgi:transposase